MVFLTACAQPVKEADAGEEQTEKDDKIEIGITFDTFIMERWQRDRDVFVSTARSLGAEVNVQNANGDTSVQLDQIDYFIEKGMDVIVIVATDGYSLQEAVKKAHDKGIKVICYDRLIVDGGSDLYVSFDNGRVGELMGESIIKELPEGGNIIMIKGPEKDYNVSLVEEGFDRTIKGHNINVVAEHNVSEWKSEEASDYLSEKDSLMTSISAIMCGNDALAGGAVRYLSERRLASKILVTGQDADLDACQRIVEGTQLMTVYKPIEILAQRAAECAVVLAKGEELTGDDLSVLNDGKSDIPYVSIEPVMVTKDNLDEVIIDSGFHLKEDVYLNVR